MGPREERERLRERPLTREWTPEPLHVPALHPDQGPSSGREDASELDEDKPGSHVFVIDIS